MTRSTAIRVMLVDDSAIIRGLVSRALKEADDISIVGTATDGAQAVALVEQYNPEVIVLDIEMPNMDGLTALPLLIAKCPKAHVIMASTLTQRNAEISMKALALGAADYLAKPSAKETQAVEVFFHELREKIRALAAQPASRPAVAAGVAVAQAAASSAAANVAAVPSIVPVVRKPIARVNAIAIASSTGGPQALQTVFGMLKQRIQRVPIFITQHMPPTFTTLLAEHLGRGSGMPCHEAKDGMVVSPGHAYVAPGDYHMQPEKKGAQVIIRLNQNPPENFCRPAADPMLRSLAQIYGGELLLCVLTGMGQDGLEGAKAVLAKEGEVVAQDQATSVVWGMPRAVSDAGLTTRTLALGEVADYLVQAVAR